MKGEQIVYVTSGQAVQHGVSRECGLCRVLLANGANNREEIEVLLSLGSFSRQGKLSPDRLLYIQVEFHDEDTPDNGYLFYTLAGPYISTVKYHIYSVGTR